MTGGGINDNEAGVDGGALYLAAGSLRLNAQMNRNEAGGNGGGVYSGGALTVAGGEYGSNAAAGGGGFYLSAGSFTLGGGAVKDNTAANGGGVYLNGGAARMEGGTLEQNNATGQGGGVYAVGGSLTMAGGEVKSNTAAGAGDGVYLSTLSSMTLLSGYIREGNGIAVYNSGNPGSYPAVPPIVAANGFEPTASGFLLEGNVTASNGVTAIPAETLVAKIADDFGGSLPPDEQRAAKKHAASTLFHELGSVPLRGLLNGTGDGVVLGDASSVQLQVNGGAPETYASIEDALAVVPRDANATITVLKPVEIRERMWVGEGRDVNLTAATPLLAKRAVGITGDLITVRDTGVLRIDGELTISGNKQNIADAAGSLLAVDGGALSLDGNAVLADNQTSGTGGAVRAVRGGFTMVGGVVRENGALDGGGVYVNGATFALGGGSLSGNTAGRHGGGVYVNGIGYTMSGGVLEGNTAVGNGGGLYYNCATGELLLSGGSIGTGSNGNVADNGAGIYVNAAKSLLLNNASITYNAASKVGGGVYVASGEVRMSGGAVSGNTAGTGARGVYLGTGAGMVFNGGLLGVDDQDDNGLVQHLAADSAPSLTVGADMKTSGGHLNFEGRAIGAGSIEPYPDNTLAALFEGDAFSYGEKLAATGAFDDVGNSPAYYVNLNPTADALVLRQYITATEPLYTEAPDTELGDSARWDLDPVTGGVDRVYLTEGLDSRELVLNTDYIISGNAVILTRDLLDTLENGTYEIAIGTPGVPGDIVTGFTVRGTARVELTGTVSGSYRFLTGAINAAALDSESTVTLLADMTIPPVTIDGGKRITLQSDGTKTLTRGEGGDLFTVLRGGLTLKDITLDGDKGNLGVTGSLVRVQGGDVVVSSGAVLENNSAANGGALSMESGSILLEDGLFQDNDATCGGGVYLTGGRLTGTGGSVKENAAATGGAVYLGGGQFTLEGGQWSENHAADKGGGVFLADGRMTATGGELSRNDTLGNGGGIYLQSGSALATSSADAAGFLLTGNTAAENGGGIYSEAGVDFALNGGQIGAKPADGDTMLDNGLYFHRDAPANLGVGYDPATGNLNLEGAHDGSAQVPLWSGFPVLGVAGKTWDDYQGLVDIANSMQYLDNGHIYNAVAVPDGNGEVHITAIEDLYRGYVHFHKHRQNPPLYWRFGRDITAADLSEVHIDGNALSLEDFQAEDGSIVLTLNGNLLQSLDKGIHQLEAYLDGDAPGAASYTFSFIIRNQDSPGPGPDPDPGPGTGPGSDPGDGSATNGSGGDGSGSGGGRNRAPRTGDLTVYEGWMLLLLLSAAGFIALVFVVARRKREREEQAEDVQKLHIRHRAAE